MVMCFTFTKDSARVAGSLGAGDAYVEGSGIGDIGNVVLRDRQSAFEEQVVAKYCYHQFEQKEIQAGPDILSRGFVYMRESGDINNRSPAACLPYDPAQK